MIVIIDFLEAQYKIVNIEMSHTCFVFFGPHLSVTSLEFRTAEDSGALGRRL